MRAHMRAHRFDVLGESSVHLFSDGVGIMFKVTFIYWRTSWQQGGGARGEGLLLFQRPRQLRGVETAPMVLWCAKER